MPLSSDLPHSHAQDLYSLLLKPYVKSTGSWKIISDEIRDLTDYLNIYWEYLNQKKAYWSKYKSSLALAKTLDKNLSRAMSNSWRGIQKSRPGCERGRFGCSCCCERCSFSDIREQYAKAKILWKAPFISSNWSNRILPWLLTCLDICRRNINEILTEGSQIIQNLLPVLRECRTRAQRVISRKEQKTLQAPNQHC